MNKVNETNLLLDIKNKSPQALEKIAAYRADKSLYESYTGSTKPLIEAINHRNIPAALALIEANVNINHSLTQGFTPLILASFHNQKEVVKALLAKPQLNIDARSSDGETALIKATSRHNDEIVELLVDAGANLNLINDHNKNSALLYCGTVPTNSMAFKLILAGADTLLNKRERESIVHLAVKNDNHALVEFLSEHHADLNALNAEPDTPLMQAARLGKSQMIQTLIKAGASVNFQTPHRNHIFNKSLILVLALMDNSQDTLQNLLENTEKIEQLVAYQKQLAQYQTQTQGIIKLQPNSYFKNIQSTIDTVDAHYRFRLLNSELETQDDNQPLQKKNKL